VAKLLERKPEIRYLEVNCMHLPQHQRTLSGLFGRVAELCGGARAARELRGRSGPGLMAAAAGQLASLDGPVVLVVDEVDQLTKKSGSSVTSSAALDSACTLEALFSLPFSPGAPVMSVIAIANAVDLLNRPALRETRGLAMPLLFEPYTAAQLRDIFKARLADSEHGDATEKSLGKVGMELRVRQVAKQSGDCRRLLSLCQQAISDASMSMDDDSQAAPGAANPRSQEHTTTQGLQATASAPAGKASPTLAEAGPVAPVTAGVVGLLTPPKSAQVAALVRPKQSSAPKSVELDPLQSLGQLPLEQQMLLCACAAAKTEAVRLADLSAGYKVLCRRLHQPLNLACKGQICSALSALEERGLLELRTARGGGGRCARAGGEPVVELAVSREALRAAVARVNTMLEQCLEY